MSDDLTAEMQRYVEIAKNYDRKAQETNIGGLRILYRRLAFEARELARSEVAQT